MAPPLQLIVACAENRVIGRGGRLPWRIPEDTAWFEGATAGGVCILGRTSFEGWPGASREGRLPVVVTSHPQRLPAGTRSAPSFPAALADAEALGRPVWICGGERIYAEALALDRPLSLYLTLIHAEPAGDVRFPEWRHLAWRERARRASADAGWNYTFLTLDRESPAGGRGPG